MFPYTSFIRGRKEVCSWHTERRYGVWPVSLLHNYPSTHTHRQTQTHRYRHKLAIKAAKQLRLKSQLLVHTYMSADLTYVAACSPDKQTGTKVMLSLHIATRVYRRGLQHNFNGSKTFRLRRSSAVRKWLLFMDETSYSH